MRRLTAIAVVGGLIMAGCAAGEAVRPPVPEPIPSAGTGEPHTASGKVTFEEGWTFGPGDLPRTVHNGERCRTNRELQSDDNDPASRLVVETGTGEVIGETELREGEITGLGPAGFDLPSQLETALIASESLVRRAACSFAFSVDLASASGSSSYSFVVDVQPSVVYSQADLDTLNWVVELVQR